MQHSQVGFPGIGIPKGSTPVFIHTEGGSYVLIDDDFFGSVYIRMNSASAQVLTIPPGLTLLQPCTIIQSGAGQLSVAAGMGVTIQSTDSWLNARTRYSAMVIMPLGSDSYDLFGDLAA